MRELSWALAVVAGIVMLTVGIAMYASRPIDRGACLETRDVPQQVTMIPVSSGKVMTIIPVVSAAHVECVRWQYPNGRRA